MFTDAKTGVSNIHKKTVPSCGTVFLLGKRLLQPLILIRLWIIAETHYYNLCNFLRIEELFIFG